MNLQLLQLVRKRQEQNCHERPPISELKARQSLLHAHCRAYDAAAPRLRLRLCRFTRRCLEAVAGCGRLRRCLPQAAMNEAAARGQAKTTLALGLEPPSTTAATTVLQPLRLSPHDAETAGRRQSRRPCSERAIKQVTIYETDHWHWSLLSKNHLLNKQRRRGNWGLLSSWGLFSSWSLWSS